MLAMLVDQFGAESRVANDGLAALSVLPRFRPDFVLLDIGMPGLDGYETCRRMRQMACGSDPVVVALTGWGQDDDKQRALSAGFDLHLTKPADPAALERLLADFGRDVTAGGRTIETVKFRQIQAEELARGTGQPRLDLRD
jgi:CheY-like chemotaxis protein